MQVNIVVIAKRRGREKRQGEEFIAYIFCEFLTGRNHAKTIGRNQDFHLCKYLQDHGNANGQLKLVVSFISARHANGAHHAFKRIGNNRFIRDRKQNVFANPTTLETPLHTTTQNIVAATYPTDTMPQRLRYCRAMAGLSGDAVALKMTIHRDYYWILEDHCERMSPTHLVEFCQATSADISFVLHGFDAPPMIPLTAPTIGGRIREFRTLKRLGVRAMMRLCGREKKSSSWSAWELGRYLPECRSLLTIAAAFGINAASFFPPAQEHQPK